MRIYEEDLPGHAEWDIAFRLGLEDDGRFWYSEHWTCYMATSGGDAQGRWSQRGDTVVLHPEQTEGATMVAMEPGTELLAVVAGDSVLLDSGIRLSLRAEPPAAPPLPRPVLAPTPPPITRPAPPIARAPLRTPVAAAEPRAAAPARIPSPALSARIQSLIDEIAPPPSGLGLQRLCREWNVLPLHSNSIYLWALRPDGVVFCIDHESFRQDGEPETDPHALYSAFVHGAQRHPELRELIPDPPTDIVKCRRCDGRGWTREPGEPFSTSCLSCAATGWHQKAGS
jgi:hypothetical protein